MRSSHRFRNSERLVDIYLRGWMAGWVIAGISHLLLTDREGRNAQWPPSKGWQHEIGLWNTCLFIITAGVLRSGDVRAKRAMVRGLAPTAGLLGAAHARALQDPHPERGTSVHRAGLAADSLAAIVGLIVYAVTSRSCATEPPGPAPVNTTRR